MSASVGMMKFPRYGKNVPNRQLRLEPMSRTLYDSLLELQKHLRKQLRVDMESVAPLPPLPCGNFPSPESSLSEWALVIHVLFGCGLPQYCCSNAGNDHHQLRVFFLVPHIMAIHQPAVLVVIKQHWLVVFQPIPPPKKGESMWIIIPNMVQNR